MKEALKGEATFLIYIFYNILIIISGTLFGKIESPHLLIFFRAPFFPLKTNANVTQRISLQVAVHVKVAIITRPFSEAGVPPPRPARGNIGANPGFAIFAGPLGLT
jgi:hypothetical protein